MSKSPIDNFYNLMASAQENTKENSDGQAKAVDAAAKKGWRVVQKVTKPASPMELYGIIKNIVASQFGIRYNAGIVTEILLGQLKIETGLVCLALFFWQKQW